MNRFKKLFERSGRKALIPFLVLGDPDIETSRKIISAVIEGGADALELGIPFSDPVADGPTIQRAAGRALSAGVTVNDCLNLVAEVSEQSGVPIGLLVYYNLIHRHGPERFCERMAAAGVDGIVVGDLPLEESGDFEDALRRHGVGCIHLVAPNTPPERARTLIDRSTAFTYVVNVLGTTGARDQLSANVGRRLKQLRALSESPLVVGFGISTPAQAAAVYDAGADGAIVGSALIRHIESYLDDGERMALEAKRFIGSFKELETKPC